MASAGTDGSPSQQTPRKGFPPYLSLASVYVVWSTTFLAMRIGVREGSGFAPWIFAGTRVLAGGVILVILALAINRTIKVPRRKLWALILSGNLIWVMGHGFLLWAEQWADSGYTALFVAAFPILGAVYDAALDRRWPSAAVIIGLTVGFGGIVFLMAPELGDAGTLTPLVLAALVFAPIALAAGFTIQRRRATGIPAVTGAAIQHLAAVPTFLLLSLITREPRIDAAPDAWWAWAYLVVFGSIVGYLAVVHALHALPPRIAMTYGYVNPVFSLAVGHLVLNEVIRPSMILGAVLVLFGVYLVFQERVAHATPRGTAPPPGPIAPAPTSK